MLSIGTVWVRGACLDAHAVPRVVAARLVAQLLLGELLDGRDVLLRARSGEISKRTRGEETPKRRFEMSASVEQTRRWGWMRRARLRRRDGAMHAVHCPEDEERRAACAGRGAAPRVR